MADCVYLAARQPALVWPRNAARAEMRWSGLLCSRQARTLAHGFNGVTGLSLPKQIGTPAA